MAIELHDDHWRAWLGDARRAVICAAERVVYARRYGWDTTDDHERLTDAVDTLAALSRQWLTDEVPCTTVGNTSAQPNSSTTPARHESVYNPGARPS